MKHLQTLLFVISICFLFAVGACSPTKTSSVPTVVQEIGGASLEDAAIAFHKALTTGDVSALDGYFVNAALARAMAPKETDGKSDQVIEEQMIKGLKIKFENNLDLLVKNAKSKGLSKGEIRLSDWKEYPSDDPELFPRVMGIVLAGNSVEGEVPVTFMIYEGRIYLFEILNTSNVFK